MRDATFRSRMKPLEMAAWDAWGLVVQHFLGSHWVENYDEIVNNILPAYWQPGYRMSLNMHSLHSQFLIHNYTYYVCMSVCMHSWLYTFRIGKSAFPTKSQFCPPAISSGKLVSSKAEQWLQSDWLMSTYTCSVGSYVSTVNTISSSSLLLLCGYWQVQQEASFILLLT